MTRPNEEPEPWLIRKARLAATMAGFHLRPTQPKHLRHLYGEPCKDCGERVVKASGPLIDGRCGGCHNAWTERQEFGDYPPAA